LETHKNLFNKIISLENLFASWHEFKRDKRKRLEVMLFERNLEDNLFGLFHELKDGIYHHSQYTAFYITDPKLRRIHKAEIRDRIVHHAIVRTLYPVFDRFFIFDSYSCRIEKGTHKAVDRLEDFIKKKSNNFSDPCFALKCDVKQFFNSVNHQILLRIIKKKIDDPNIIGLLQEIIGSFSSEITSQPQLQLFDFRGEKRERERPRPSAASGKGIPIGNLTSQLFANIYMNEFDQFVKHKLKVKHYCRYTDDFVIASSDREYLENLLPKIELFLNENLKLKLHPGKISVRKYQQGIDFLGYVVLPHHRLVRTKTKNRIFKKLKIRVQEFKTGLISEKTLFQSLNSYLGVLSHANAHDLGQELLNRYWFWLSE
jgi:retron-type reverse transcriptase